MNRTFDTRVSGRGRFRGSPIVLFALEPRSYSEAIGATIAHMRPELEVATVSPKDLACEVERRRPTVVVCSCQRPAGCGVPTRWVRYRPYEDPDVVRVDGRAERVPGLDFGYLLGLIDRLCEDTAEAVG